MSESFMPHGMCFLWQTDVLLLHVVSDAAIAGAYFSIPLAIVSFAKRRADLKYKWILSFFAAFIVACGITHLFGIWVIWNPDYWADGLVKAATAAISVVTAVLLWPLLPKLLALPSPAQLRVANASLEKEVEQRIAAQAELERLNDELERRVEERTRELERSNAELEEARNRLERGVEGRTRDLQASEKRFKELLESAPDAIVISREDGTIELTNAQVKNLFGYEQSELLDQPIEMLLPESLRQKHVAHRGAYVKHPEVREMGADLPLMAMRRDGTSFPVDISLSPIETDQGIRIAASVRDVTQRREHERKLVETMEALNRSNRELEQTSQELEAQHEELQQTNEELEEQRSALEEEKEKLQVLANQLAASHTALEQKAREADLANRHKSVFLANMSHELRTPLNSIMILSQILSDNAGRNLTDDQTKQAQTIYSSGKDLLGLINDILDLSKIEAGKMELNISEFAIDDVVASIRRTFSAEMHEKALDFVLEAAPDLPETMESDQVRLEQIVKNLVSNALKFTNAGSVTVRFEKDGADDGGNTLAISVADTGIGIPESELSRIFEAFKQVDSSLSKRYEGTGLGLSISRNLAKSLGGALAVESVEGEGSTFTLRLPFRHEGDARVAETSVHLRVDLGESARGLEDDRGEAGGRDRTILVVEDDEKFADTLLSKCRRGGFKCLHAADGNEALEMARAFKPSAIILDLKLPKLNGLTVLDELKSDPATRHIPVHVMSVEDREDEVLRLGAARFVAKPLSLYDLDRTIREIERLTARKTKNVLLVEDDPAQCAAIRELLSGGSIKLKAVHSVRDALESLESHHYDCVILDLALNGEDGIDVLKSMNAADGDSPPVVVYTGKDLSKAELSEIGAFTDSIVVKGRDSHQRLLDEVTLFLHSVDTRQLSAPAAASPAAAAAVDDALAAKRVLIVDDDLRNVYSLREVLLSRGLETTQAHDGAEAIAALDNDPGVDIVLMDIMMPGMDGIRAIRGIRENPRFSDLPIIALTAKAMKEDREECLRAGANDYMSKPVDVERLLSLMRIWLAK